MMHYAQNGNCLWCSPATYLPLAQVVGYSIGEVCASDSGGRGFNPRSRHNKDVKKNQWLTWFLSRHAPLEPGMA